MYFYICDWWMTAENHRLKCSTMFLSEGQLYAEFSVKCSWRWRFLERNELKYIGEESGMIRWTFFMIVDWDSIGSVSRSQCSFCLSHHFMEKLIYFDKICQQHFGGYWWAVIYFCQAGVLTDVLGHWTRDSGGQRLFNLSGDRLTHTSHACLLLLSMSWI